MIDTNAVSALTSMQDQAGLAPLSQAILQNQMWLAALENSDKRAPSLGSVRANLRDLWAVSGHAEIEVAMVAARDALNRIALNLVR